MGPKITCRITNWVPLCVSEIILKRRQTQTNKYKDTNHKKEKSKSKTTNKQTN